MKQIILGLSLVSSLSACGSSQQQSKKTETTTQTSPSSLKSLRNDGAMLLDVRTPEEFAAGSVDGAVNIPLNELEGRLAEVKDQKHIIVFCQSGNRSGKAIKILEANGIKNTTNGGGWRDVQNELAK